MFQLAMPCFGLSPPADGRGRPEDLHPCRTGGTTKAVKMRKEGVKKASTAGGSALVEV